MSTVGNEAALNYTHTWAVAGQGTTQGVGWWEPGKPDTPTEPFRPVSGGAQRTGRRLGLQPSSLAQPEKGAGERGARPSPSGRRESPESPSRSAGEVPPPGSRIDSASNMMGDSGQSLPSLNFSFTLRKGEAGREVHIQLSAGSLSLLRSEQFCFKQFAEDSLLYRTVAVRPLKCQAVMKSNGTASLSSHLRRGAPAPRACAGPRVALWLGEGAPGSHKSWFTPRSCHVLAV